MLLKISKIVRTFFPILILLGVAGGFAFRRWIKTDKGRAIWDAAKLRVPIFGGLVQKTALARFSRTLGVAHPGGRSDPRVARDRGRHGREHRGGRRGARHANAA